MQRHNFCGKVKDLTGSSLLIAGDEKESLVHTDSTCSYL